MTETILEKIYRFPVKGFLGHELPSTTLNPGFGISNDRRYAITREAEDTGEWMPSRNFYVNSRIDGMSKFECDFDDKIIHLKNVLGEKLEFQLDNQSSLEHANTKIKEFLAPVGVDDELPTPKIIDRGNGAIWDYSDTPISIINAETVKAIDEKLGTTLDPRRFRGNLLISGLPAWEEFSWMGKRLQVGNCVLDVHRPIDRCPTPGVNPVTGERDVEVTPGLQEHFGHIYCGMYANVVKGGELITGDKIQIIGNAEINLQDTFVVNASKYPLWPRMAKVTSCDVGEEITRITLATTSPWQPPEAKIGQRLKLHLGTRGWTQEYITSASGNEFKIEVQTSRTADPITQYLRKGLSEGEHIIISGPFGRV